MNIFERDQTSFRRALAVAAMLSIVMPVASSEPARADASGTSERSVARVVGEICSNVLQVQAGTVLNSACEANLTLTINSQVSATRTAKGWVACEAKGLARETPPFSRCVLDYLRQHDVGNDAGIQETSATADMPKIAAPTGTSVRSFMESSSVERRRREEDACALLALTPGSEAFSQCVTQLGLAMDVR